MFSYVVIARPCATDSVFFPITVGQAVSLQLWALPPLCTWSQPLSPAQRYHFSSFPFSLLNLQFSFLDLSPLTLKIWGCFSQLNHTHAHSLQLLHHPLFPFTAELFESVVHLHSLQFLSFLCLLNALYISLLPQHCTKTVLVKFSYAFTLLNPMANSQSSSWAVSNIWQLFSPTLWNTFFSCLSGKHIFFFFFTNSLAILSKPIFPISFPLQLIHIGVSQGSSFGPFLFAIYIAGDLI